MAKTTKKRDAQTRTSDLKQATAIIGSTSAARLAWAVRFIGEDPANWHPAVAVPHVDCLHSLARPILSNMVEMPHPPDAFTPDEVGVLHGELRALFRDLLGKNPTGPAMVMIPTEGRTEGLVRATS